MTDDLFLPVVSSQDTRSVNSGDLQASMNSTTGEIAIYGTDGTVTITGSEVEIYKPGAGFNHITDPALAESLREAVRCIFVDSKVTASELTTLQQISLNPQMPRTNQCTVIAKR